MAVNEDLPLASSAGEASKYLLPEVLLPPPSYWNDRSGHILHAFLHQVTG